MTVALRRGAVAVGALASALVLTACAPPAVHRPGPEPTATTVTPQPTKPTTRATAPTPTTVTTVTLTGAGSRGLATTDRLERRHRLAQALPHSTPHYRIDFTVDADGRLRLVVTLLAVLNDPRDLGGYQAELRRSKAEALEFIAAQGDEPSSYTVAFVPPEAGAL